MGEKGDTDYEDLLVGLHKTVILGGCAEYACEMLRSEDSLKREDLVPKDSPNIAFAEGYEAQDISTALETLGIM